MSSLWTWVSLNTFFERSAEISERSNDFRSASLNGHDRVNLAGPLGADFVAKVF
jgi:hypothetical protein